MLYRIYSSVFRKGGKCVLLPSRLVFVAPVAAAGLMVIGCGGAGGGGSLGPSRIAFVSNRSGTAEIYIMDANGGNLANVSAGNGEGHSWDPLGTRIAFTSNRSGNTDVWVVNADGSGLTQLTNDASDELDISWHPSADRLVYIKLAGGLYELDLVTNTETLISNVGSFILNPRYSPSGALIVAARSPTGTDTEIQTIAPVPGSSWTNLTNDAANQDRLPKWSPNGQQIAWLKSGNLWVMDSSGANQTQLTTSGDVTDHAFSPNGQYLVYVAGNDIWRLTWNGSSWGSPVQLTSTGNNSEPCWTADSLNIVFTRLNDIWIMKFDGSNQTNLTNDPSVDSFPQCSP